MTTIVTRIAKGSPLTVAEIDANFTNLNNDKAELINPTFNGNFVKLPVRTTTQRNAIPSPSTGMIIYNSTTNTFEGYSGSWSGLGGAGIPTGYYRTNKDVLFANSETQLLVPNYYYSISPQSSNPALFPYTYRNPGINNEQEIPCKVQNSANGTLRNDLAAGDLTPGPEYYWALRVNESGQRLILLNPYSVNNGIIPTQISASNTGDTYAAVVPTFTRNFNTILKITLLSESTTSAPTLNVNGLGNDPIYKFNNGNNLSDFLPLDIGDISGTNPHYFYWATDGVLTGWVLINPVSIWLPSNSNPVVSASDSVNDYIVTLPELIAPVQGTDLLFSIIPDPAEVFINRFNVDGICTLSVVGGPKYNISVPNDAQSGGHLYFNSIDNTRDMLLKYVNTILYLINPAESYPSNLSGNVNQRLSIFGPRSPIALSASSSTNVSNYSGNSAYSLYTLSDLDFSNNVPSSSVVISNNYATLGTTYAASGSMSTSTYKSFTNETYQSNINLSANKSNTPNPTSNLFNVQVGNHGTVDASSMSLYSSDNLNGNVARINFAAEPHSLQELAEISTLLNKTISPGVFSNTKTQSYSGNNTAGFTLEVNQTTPLLSQSVSHELTLGGLYNVNIISDIYQFNMQAGTIHSETSGIRSIIAEDGLNLISNNGNQARLVASSAGGSVSLETGERLHISHTGVDFGTFTPDMTPTNAPISELEITRWIPVKLNGVNGYIPFFSLPPMPA